MSYESFLNWADFDWLEESDRIATVARSLAESAEALIALNDRDDFLRLFQHGISLQLASGGDLLVLPNAIRELCLAGEKLMSARMRLDAALEKRDDQLYSGEGNREYAEAYEVEHQKVQREAESASDAFFASTIAVLCVVEKLRSQETNRNAGN